MSIISDLWSSSAVSSQRDFRNRNQSLRSASRNGRTAIFAGVISSLILTAFPNRNNTTQPQKRPGKLARPYLFRTMKRLLAGAGSLRFIGHDLKRLLELYVFDHWLC